MAFQVDLRTLERLAIHMDYGRNVSARFGLKFSESGLCDLDFDRRDLVGTKKPVLGIGRDFGSAKRRDSQRQESE